MWECLCSCGNPEIVLVTTKALLSGHTRSCGCLVSEAAIANLPTPKDQRKRYKKRWEITDDEGRVWYSLFRAAQILGVVEQQILLWKEACGWLDGDGIETKKFTDGLGRNVPYYSKEDVDTIADVRRDRKPLPVIPDHTPLIEIAAQLKTSVRVIRKQLKRIGGEVAKFDGKRKDGHSSKRTYLANRVFDKLKVLNASRLSRLKSRVGKAGRRIAERNMPIYKTCADVYAE